MRILVAPQEYKGTLTAPEAAEIIAAVLAQLDPDAVIDRLPMADGGPGTAAALAHAVGGEWRTVTAHDPLMRPLEAQWLLLSNGTAVIEAASASGLLRLTRDELDPRRATTFGTGELLRSALDSGCTSVLLTVGGTATNDGGGGMAQALSFRLLDAEGRDLEPGGTALARLARIDPDGAHPGIAMTSFVVATDVSNPLCGPDGASFVYGPQKGADEAAVAELDTCLYRFAEVIKRDLGPDIVDVPGAGAAGGLGGGAMAFLGARVEGGADVVAKAADLDQRILQADLVITGEGRLDGQTGFGKGPAHIALLARAAGKRTICVPGSLGAGHESVVGLFDLVEPQAAVDPAALTPQIAKTNLEAAVRRAVARLDALLP